MTISDKTDEHEAQKIVHQVPEYTYNTFFPLQT